MSDTTQTQPVFPMPEEAEATRLTSVWLLAVVVTIFGTALAYIVSGQPEIIGIDDAAITRNYAQNIANGHGYVYYAGGERVEGATTLLWTLLLSLTYLITDTPEFLIIGMAGVFTLIAVGSVLSLSVFMAWSFDLAERPVLWLTSLGLLALPGFFFWSVFTMMELALWSAALMVLLWRLARLVERPKPWSRPVIAIAFLLPLIRPEGIAVTLGLLAFACVLMGRVPRGIIVSAALATGSLLAATAFRLGYFGYPVPNTFYAKVSSDRMQDFVDGAKYLFSFVGEFPFAEIMLITLAASALWTLARLASDRPQGARGWLLVVATVFGVLAIYTALGGDHFEYWRFFQPITPLLPLVMALSAVAIWQRLAPATGPNTFGRVAAAFLVGVLWLGISHGDFRQARFDLVKEFRLVRNGIDFGRYMNTLDDDAVLGVGAAGGIALGYDGPMLDLLGLNWVEMAHANPVKTGFRNHASFDRETFWRHTPDVLPGFDKRCEETSYLIEKVDAGLTKGLLIEPRFQQTYAPVRFRDGDRCWRAIAKRDWIATMNDARIEPLDWDDVALTYDDPVKAVTKPHQAAVATGSDG